jgi:hypothetical protein
MDPAIAAKTKETLGKIIKKPPLTDKLLGKPPFRFLHDIFSAVSKLIQMIHAYIFTLKILCKTRTKAFNNVASNSSILGNCVILNNYFLY